MKQFKQNGFAAVEALLVVVILAIIGGTGYFVLHAKQNTDESLANTSSSQPALSKSKKKASTPAQTKAASKDLVIKEWGITVPNGTDDVFTYKLDGEYADLSTQKLTAADSACSVDTTPAVGIIQRAAATDPVYDDGTTAADVYKQSPGSVAKVGNYYYVYTSPQAGCSDNDSTNQLQHATISEIRALVPLAKASE